MKTFVLLFLASFTMFLTSCGENNNNGKPYNPETDELAYCENNMYVYAEKSTGNWGLSYAGKEVLKREYADITGDLPKLVLEKFPIAGFIKDFSSTTIVVKGKIFRENFPGYISVCCYGKGSLGVSNRDYNLGNHIMAEGAHHEKYVDNEFGRKKYVGRDIDLCIVILLDDRIFLSFDNDRNGNNTLKEVYSYDEFFNMTLIIDEKVIKEYDQKIKASKRRS